MRCAHVGLVNRDIVKRSLRSFLFMGRGNRTFLMKIFYISCPLICRVFSVGGIVARRCAYLLRRLDQKIYADVTRFHVITVDSIFQRKYRTVFRNL